MVLIIAEKPTLARNIVAGIDGKMEKKDGYFIGDSYIVSWAFGHLFSLVDIEHYYGSESGRWTLDNLPCFPKKFEFELRRGKDKQIDSGVNKQFRILKTLCNRSDVDTIVNAGDADREGEIIVRLCIDHALGEGHKKSLKRLWLPDQTPKTVRAALEDMKDESEYDNLAAEGYARTFIDWLYGVNLTRYATIRAGRLLRVGRVIVPIVQAVYERDMQIRNFKPETYYILHSDAETRGYAVELNGKQRFTPDELDAANERAALYNATGATVLAVDSKDDVLHAGKLYSLSTLQGVLGKKYKMSMADSLKIVQKLYEEGYLTYPRTNSEYLATAEKDKARAIISNIKKLGYPVRFKDSKYIFDDSKIESHSALTPTYKIPDKNALSPDEAKVYSTVLRRFVAVFCEEDCIVQKSEIRIAVGDIEEFALRGTVIRQAGWTRYDDYTTKDKILPPLEVGESVNIDFAPQQKQTTPPRHYTVETLNKYLKNPFKEDKSRAAELCELGEIDDADDYRAIFEGLELGTEATRSGIIENARASGYIEIKKDVYTILEGGEVLVESLRRMQIDMDKYKTSELGKALKRVYRGQMSVQESVRLAEAEIAKMFTLGGAAPVPMHTDTGKYGEIVGICPLCGANVVRGKFNYGCMKYQNGCDFKVGVNICKREIPISEVRKLLATGTTDKICGFISKTGKRFDGRLALVGSEVKFNFD